MNKIDLSQVTLWTCIWTPDETLIDRAFRAMCHCMSHANFGRALFFSYADPGIECDMEVVRISRLTPKKWNLFVNNEVVKHINTPFAMSVHEDGFIVNPDLWDKRFLDYDYIGAPWPDGVVGNGGFSISSKTMLNSVAYLNQQDGDIPSDVFFCRNNRKTLEEWGIRFAPLSLALNFSLEEEHAGAKAFGFHGKQANPVRYAEAWKQLEAREQQIRVISRQFDWLLDRWGGWRKATWTAAFDAIKRNNAKNLIETGCYRGTEADGCSTAILASIAHEMDGKLDSYELDTNNIAVARNLLEQIGIGHRVEFHPGDSVLSLANRRTHVDFAYLDSFDCGTGSHVPAQEHQLAELECVLPLLKSKAIILLDDHVAEGGGKTAMSMRRLGQRLFKQVLLDYQVLFCTEDAYAPAKTRFAVICCHDGRYAELARKTIYENKAQYCHRHGYDLRVERFILPKYVDTLTHASGFSWSRMEKMLELVQSKAYDWVWCIGTDTLITNFNVTLDSIVAMAETHEAMTSPPPKYIAPRVSFLPKPVLHWAAPKGHVRTGKKHLIIAGEAFSPLQADSFLVRCSPEGAAYLKDILAQYEHYKHHVWVENQAMNDLFEKHAALTHIVPQHILNSYDYETFDLDEVTHGVDCYGNRGQWQKGDFVLHMPGIPLEKRMALVTQYEKEIIK